MNAQAFQEKANFIWQVADDLLRGAFKEHEYGDVTPGPPQYRPVQETQRPAGEADLEGPAVREAGDAVRSAGELT